VDKTFVRLSQLISALVVLQWMSDQQMVRYACCVVKQPNLMAIGCTFDDIMIAVQKKSIMKHTNNRKTRKEEKR
jgi:hypothetical protein